MKKLIFASLVIAVILPSSSQAQYWTERVTEQSFEGSDLYFHSHFLNTYGLPRFQDVAAGTFDDPFLNLHINPAHLPQIPDGSGLLYFDFRGDRREADIVTQYYNPYIDLGFYPDPRWYRETRQEPEPVISLGLLAYPFRARLEKVFVGATYQAIYKEEPFYTVPAWIYYPYFAYDSFGERAFPEGKDIPVQDRYYGRDELSTEAHLFSVFAGCPIARETNLGVGVNTVRHSRDGSYVNLRADEYGHTLDWNYRSYEERARTQDYQHVDFTVGVRQTLSRGSWIGATAGYLSGEADQSYLAVDSAVYSQGAPDPLENWYYHYRRSQTRQNWNRDGHAWHLGADIRRDLRRGRVISGYYRYQKTDLDLNNATAIRDTSYSASDYFYSEGYSHYRSLTGATDQRNGTGTWEQQRHDALGNLRWELTAQSQVSLSVFVSTDESDVFTSEPVDANRWSEWHHWQNDTLRYGSEHRLVEDKELEWRYRSTHVTTQLPVVLREKLGQKLTLMLGVNRMLERWHIREQTIAFFTTRERVEQGQTQIERNFAERYTKPDRKFTENHTAVMTSLELEVAPQFGIRLMVEPETEDEFEIKLWWLSFRLVM